MILPPLKKDSHSLPSRDTAKYLTSNGSDSAPDELVANDAELSCIQTSTHQVIMCFCLRCRFFAVRIIENVLQYSKIILSEFVPNYRLQRCNLE